MTADQLDLGDAPKSRRGVKEPKEAQAPPPEPASNMLALIGIRVSDLPTLDVDKLDRLLAFQEKLMARQAQIDFNEAKQRVLKDLADIKIYKRKSVRYDINKQRPSLGQAEAFKYAPLEDIDEVVAPLLAREGLGVSYTTTPRAGEGGGLLITMTLNKGDHSEKYELPLPLDTTGGKDFLACAAPRAEGGDMTKFSCSMISGSDIFYATVIAEDAKQAREMAAAETKKGRPREWSVAVLESEVDGPARFLGSGAQDA